jgi:hypothetical protein
VVKCQSSTCRIGNVNGEEVHAPFNSMVPCVDPNDIVVGGWDISKMNLADAMVRAGVLPVELQSQVAPQMRAMVPLPAIYDSDFIAANQESRADNVLTGSKKENMEQLRVDMRDFKAKHGLDKVVVLWTANTERFSEVVVGMNDTYANLMVCLPPPPLDRSSHSSAQSPSHQSLAVSQIQLSPSGCYRARRGGAIAVHVVRHGVHPRGRAVYQRLTPKHLRAGVHGGGDHPQKPHRRRRLQERADQDEVRVGRFPSGRRAQATLHRVV